MARSPRRWIPGAFWFLTSRCIRSEFRLRPDDERTQLIGYWLARAQTRYPGVRVFACVQMSNHFHLAVQDELGETSQFMEYFVGQLAKDINRLDGVRGPLFERRFAPVEIVDREALLEKIAYTLTNPVAADLVAHPSDWPGLLRVGRAAPEAAQRTFRRLRRGDFERAKKRAERFRMAPPCEADFIEEAVLTLALPDGVTEAEIRDVTETRIAALTEARGKTPLLGAKKVLSRSPFWRPKWTKRSRRPLCHASTQQMWLAYLDGWRTFIDRYRTASELFRSGVVDALFPAYSFRPSMRVSGAP